MFTKMVYTIRFLIHCNITEINSCIFTQLIHASVLCKSHRGGYQSLSFTFFIFKQYLVPAIVTQDLLYKFCPGGNTK